MSKNDNASRKRAGKVYVAHSKKSGVTKAEIRDLLAEADQPDAEIEFLDPDDETAVVVFSGEDALVIPLENALSDDNGIERIVVRAAQGACAIVGVWKPGEMAETIHSIVSKYGAAQVPWDSDRLKNALDTDCPSPFQTPSGSQSKPHDIRPNKC